MFVVKLTFNYGEPVFRQTPNFSGIWGDYKFVIDPNLKECDFWIIYTEYKLDKETCICNKENIFFLPGEGYNTSPKYPKNFLDQFGKIITVQREIIGNNVIYYQNALPWFVEKSYDELLNLSVPAKTKLISIVSSAKAFTEGHRKRLDFAQKLKQHFGDSVDLFGRCLNPFDKKWDVLAPYKYHIAIENDSCDDWVTEKFFDPILAYSYPFYYGCPNIGKYISTDSFTRIDINDFAESIKIIEKVINDESVYNTFIKEAKIFRNVLLNEQQLFPMLTHLIKENGSHNNIKNTNTIVGLENFYQVTKKSFLQRVINKILFKLKEMCKIFLDTNH